MAGASTIEQQQALLDGLAKDEAEIESARERVRVLQTKSPQPADPAAPKVAVAKPKGKKAKLGTGTPGAGDV